MEILRQLGNFTRKSATARKSIKTTRRGPETSDLWPLSNLLLIFGAFYCPPSGPFVVFFLALFYCYNNTIKLIFIGHRDGYLHSDTQLPV